jgi:hypothetical protein
MFTAEEYLAAQAAYLWKPADEAVQALFRTETLDLVLPHLAVEFFPKIG